MKTFLAQFEEASAETFCGQNEAEDTARELLAKADAQIANFKKFFAEIDMKEPDSVSYALRDAKLSYEDLGL